MRYYIGVDWADQTHAVWVVPVALLLIGSRTRSALGTGGGQKAKAALEDARTGSHRDRSWTP
jgi:hypothetical protein